MSCQTVFVVIIPGVAISAKGLKIYLNYSSESKKPCVLYSIYMYDMNV